MGQELTSQQTNSKGQIICQGYKSFFSENNLDGMLKISDRPFAGCVQKDSLGQIVYLEKCRSLCEQIQLRIGKDRQYFHRSQMVKMIQSMVYTLANCEQNNITFKDINSSLIFVAHRNGNRRSSTLENKIQFKLMPHQLIQQSTYQRLLTLASSDLLEQADGYTFSPEQIIAFRARQKNFQDPALVTKSLIFSLGIVLLQTATLCTSHRFYDQETLDIYGEVIEESLEQVKERYGEIVASIVANMLDFDFDERVETWIQLAQWMLHQIEREQKNHNLQDFTKEKIQSEGSISQENSNERFVNASSNVKQNKEPLRQSSKPLNDQQSHEQCSPLPVCCQQPRINLRRNQQKVLIKSKPVIRDNNKQNTQSNTSNKIPISTKQVSVYLQKNYPRVQQSSCHLDFGSRLIYSPFMASRVRDLAQTKTLANESLYGRSDRSIPTTKRMRAFGDDTCRTSNNYIIPSERFCLRKDER